MGCGGGYRDLFRIIDNCGYSRRGCEGDRPSQNDYYQQDDSEEKLIIIKKMYAEDLIDDEEYQGYKQKIYDRSISFDDLVALKRIKSNENNRTTKPSKTKSDSTEPYNVYKVKLEKLQESKQNTIKVQEELLSIIKDLEKEKRRMENLAETMLKSSEETAEKYINKKIDLEENIQNIVRRNEELVAQVEEIDSIIKNLMAKELNQEAIRLQKELSNISLEDK